MRNYLSTIGCALFLGSGLAQSPASDHAWLSTGKVSARITGTGIHADNSGGFILNSPIQGEAPINLLSHLTPWICAFDPAENSKTACEMNDPLVSDWSAGFKGVPSSSKVWKVTSEQIAAHRADFLDNGVIDNPIPEIFAWPGCENPHSLEMNGFDLGGISFSETAPFFDTNIGGIYEPSLGDYPYLNLGNIPSAFLSNSFVFAPFYDNGENELSHGRPTDMVGHLVAFTYDCPGNDFLNNSIFFLYGGFINTGFEHLASMFLGVYADFDIGNPSDDYLGYTDVKYEEKIYCYNSDTLYDAFAGTNPPMVSLMPLRGIVTPAGLIQRPQYFIPIYEGSGFPAPTLKPTWHLGFNQRIQGTWLDDNLMTLGGLGYGGNISTRFAFTDKPTNPDGWSEMVANNPLGNRKAVFSYGPTNALAVNGGNHSFIFALTASDKIGLTEQLNHLEQMRLFQEDLLNTCWHCPSLLDSMDCEMTLYSLEPSVNSSVSISPNPASTYLSLQSERLAIREVKLFDMLGNMVLSKYNSNAPNQDVHLETSNLPPGLYLAHWRLEDGAHGVSKVVVAH